MEAEEKEDEGTEGADQPVAGDAYDISKGGREVRVSDVASLRQAVDDPSVGRVLISAGVFELDEPLHVRRAVWLVGSGSGVDVGSQDNRSNAEVDGMGIKALRALIESAGMSHTDCFEKSDLRMRAHKAAAALCGRDRQAICWWGKLDTWRCGSSGGDRLEAGETTTVLRSANCCAVIWEEITWRWKRKPGGGMTQLAVRRTEGAVAHAPPAPPSPRPASPASVSTTPPRALYFANCPCRVLHVLLLFSRTHDHR